MWNEDETKIRTLLDLSFVKLQRPDGKSVLSLIYLLSEQRENTKMFLNYYEIHYKISVKI